MGLNGSLSACLRISELHLSDPNALFLKPMYPSKSPRCIDEKILPALLVPRVA